MKQFKTNKVPLTEFSHEEINNAFLSFSRRFEEFDTFKERNRTIYKHKYLYEDDEENFDDQQENIETYSQKNNKYHIIMEEEKPQDIDLNRQKRNCQSFGNLIHIQSSQNQHFIVKYMIQLRY